MIKVGIDEVGRGPLSGRVYTSAVILKPNFDIPGLKDSKKLSDAQRRKLFNIIYQNSLQITIGYATVEEINQLNISQATYLAMERALSKITIDYDEILVDGNYFPFKNINGRAIIKGDNLIPEIMASSTSN